MIEQLTSVDDDIEWAQASSVLAGQLNDLIARLAREDHVSKLARTCNLPVDRIRLLLDTYCNEARVGLALIEPNLRVGMRVLEVGSGIGLLGSILAQNDIDVVGIEPGAAGFGFMPELAAIIASDMKRQKSFVALPIGVAQLDEAVHGRFDFIFSINVLEHLRELDEAVAAMSRVLAPDGNMVHMCPNYAVPYEPHLTIPLIPGFPRLTKHLFPARVRHYPGLWEDLNFITASRLRRLGKKNQLTVTFDPSVMGAMVRRLLTDHIFAERQSRLIRAASNIVLMIGGLAIIDRIPPELASPMVARFRKSKD